MIKRTLYFGQPCSLKLHNRQLEIIYKGKTCESKSVPVEDAGIIILDNSQISITNALITALCENNTAIINCDAAHLPLGLMLPWYSHHVFTEKNRFQISASVPLYKNLWQQSVSQKIANQAALLKTCGIEARNMEQWSRQVKSGDPENLEGRAAAYYWDKLFYTPGKFIRYRYGGPPNNLLNYGYAILRACMARALVVSGMIPSIGIHHHNKYNPWCLADDMMETYRPFVDLKVLEIMREMEDISEMTPDLKRMLLSIPVMDVIIDKRSSPLAIAVQMTTASLSACFEGKTRKLKLPVLTFE